MAAAVGDSRGSAGKKLKKSLKKKKKLKTAARAVASELEDGDADAADAGGNVLAERGPRRRKAGPSPRAAGDASAGAPSRWTSSPRGVRGATWAGW